MAFHHRKAKPKDLSVLADLRWRFYQETNEAGEGSKASFIEVFGQLLPAVDSRGLIVHFYQRVGFQRTDDRSSYHEFTR